MEEKVAALKLDKNNEKPAGEFLHISAFVIVENGDRVLLLRTLDPKGEMHWHLAARLLKYGEHPDDAARDIAKEWFGLDVMPKFLEVQNFVDHHWDICFVYELNLSSIETSKTKEYKFFPKAEIPWSDIGRSQGDVLKKLGF